MQPRKDRAQERGEVDLSKVSFEGIDNSIKAEQIASRRESRQLQKIAEEVLPAIRSVIANHHKNFADRLIKAEEGFKNVVVPWLEELQSSGRLSGLLNRNRWEIEIARDIYYTRLQNIQRSFVDAHGHVTVESVKEHIKLLKEIDQSPTQILESIKRSLSSDGQDRWQALLTIEKSGRQREKSYELVLTPWPNQGAGFGYAMAIEDYRTRIAIDQLEDNFHLLDPKIWIGLADWISSGRTIKHIEKQLRKPKR